MAILPVGAVKLYDSSNVEMAVQDGVAIPANTSGILAHGSDGAIARALATDSSGRQVSVGAGTAGTPAGGIMSVQGVVGGQAIPFSAANGGVPAFMASTNGTIASGTILNTVVSIAYLIHTAGSSKTIKIRRIVVSGNGGTNGDLNAQGSFITAENGTPGGVSVPILGVSRADSAEGTDTFRIGAAAPTRVAGSLISWSMNIDGSGSEYVWVPDSEGKPITLRAGVLEGFEIRAVTTNTLVKAENIAVTFYWTEQ